MIDKMKSIKVIASIIMVLFQVWVYLPKGSYYILDALLLFILSLLVFLQKRESFWGFLILSFAFNNLMDEVFFDPTKLQMNEFLLLIIVPIIWYVKKSKK